jgi:hypothetical protein
METAIEKQRAATGELRRQTARLSEAVARLGDSVQFLKGDLDALAADASRAQQAARDFMERAATLERLA